ncbi:MAG TPA: NAD-dependent epimerase [Prolixibacteraceae bacterium]|nr:NAD-dependent epimerase [Prolixibacteraceae bacterium]
MKILVTGTAGFIGFHLAKTLLERGDEVVGIDNINDYYEVELKYSRLAETGINRDTITYNHSVQSSIYPSYQFVKLDLADHNNLKQLFTEQKFYKVINLAAQAGVRYSLENPQAYIDANITGFLNILECCRYNQIKHLVYASSSSVYGNNSKMPLSTADSVDHPISLYAATKKSNELIAHTYSHLFGIPTTGLRFFTVYGPYGRPDMALFLFTKAIIEGKPIQVFNNGEMKRDFTYVDDIVGGVTRVLDHVPQPDSKNLSDPSVSKTAPYKIYNIGNSSPVRLMDFIEAIETKLGIHAIKEMLPMQPGDVPMTWADTSDLEANLDYRPDTSIKDGVGRFIDWYKSYYKL